MTDSTNADRPLGNRPPAAAMADLAAVAAVVAFVFALFAPPLLRGQIPWFMDIVAQFYPVRFHAAQLLRAGEWPFWNRTYYLGVPLLANPQWGLLYPGNWPFLLWPSAQTFTLAYPAHIVIGALGCYWLTREIVGRRGAAWVAAAFSICNSWTWAHLAFGAYLNVTAWTPWVVWCAVRWSRVEGAGGKGRMGLKGPKGRMGKTGCVVAGAGMWGLQLLTGAPQLAWYAALNYALLGVAMTFFGGRSVGRGRFRPLVALAAMGALGAGIAAIQLIPTALFVRECERAGGLAWPEVSVGALTLGELWRALCGKTGFPEDAETTCFFGLGGVALIALSLALMLRRRQRRTGVSPVACSTTPDARQTPDEPLTPDARQAGRLSYTLAALWALLIADLLFCNRAVGRALFEFFPLYGNFHDPKRILGIAQVWMCVLAGAGVVALADAARATRMGDTVARRLPGDACEALAVGLGFAAAAFCLFFSFQRVDRKVATPRECLGEAPAALVATLGRGAAQRFIAVDGTPFISPKPTPLYSYNYTSRDFATMAMPNLGAYYGLQDAQGYDPFIPQQYARWLEQVNETPQRMIRRHFGLVNIDAAFRHGATPGDPAPWDAVVCQRELLDALKREPGFALNGAVENLTRDGRIVAYLPPHVSPYVALRSDTTQIAREQPLQYVKTANRLVIEVPAATEPRVLRVADPRLPGWTATLDGQRVEFAGDGTLMEVALPQSARSQRIELRYTPPGLLAGVAISLSSLGALLALMVMARRTRDRAGEATGADGMMD